MTDERANAEASAGVGSDLVGRVAAVDRESPLRVRIGRTSGLLSDNGALRQPVPCLSRALRALPGAPAENAGRARSIALHEGRRPQRDSNRPGAHRRKPWHDADLHRKLRRFGRFAPGRVIPRAPAVFRRRDMKSAASWRPCDNRMIGSTERRVAMPSQSATSREPPDGKG
jgi:hypothetical protein